jgi:cytochrome c peroxidase
MKRACAVLLAIMLGAAFPGGHAAAQVLPPPPPSLKTVPVPEPTNLALFVRNKTAAIALGKALFWDMQVGSDGIQACASCHFHAGADSRRKNQLNPGTAHAATTFEVGRPNHVLQPGDFPFHRLGDPASRFSPVLFDSDDVVSSQGVFDTKFVDVVPGQAQEMCSRVPDPVWNVGGTNVRRVAPRNAPSVINAIFNFRNLWNGRGNAVFNGVSTFGARDTAARVLEVQLDGSVLPVPVAIDHGSVASVAVGPPVSADLMSCAGRTWPKIGKKLLGLVPLGRQVVDPQDSVLGTLANSARRAGAPGLKVSYATLVRDAFEPRYWDSKKVVSFPAGVLTLSDPTGVPLTTNQYTVMQANFPLFFGLAVQLYQATLVSDDSPFDRFMDGGGEGGANTNALTPQQKLGLAVFTNVGLNPTVGAGGCIGCHAGAEFTVASTSRLGLVEPPDVLAPPPMAEGVIERMAMALQGALRALVFATNFATLEPGTLPLDFDPRGAPIEILQGLAPDAPVAFSGVLPGEPGVCGAALIPLVLTPNPGLALGPLPFATAALTVAPDCTQLFDVAIRSAPSGDYPVLVGGVPRGVITVVPDAFYDAGFYNIGVRPTGDDIGLGGEAPAGVPLAFVRRIQLGLPTPEITGLPGADLPIAPTDTIAVNGAFKAPSLRNVELTAPYFHDGGMATLEQVLDFYDRGGDFHELNIQNLDAAIVTLGLSDEEKAAVVAFLKSLTDDRVRFEMAPCDHPQLLVPNGHPGDEARVTDDGTGTATDALMEIPAVGTVGSCVSVDGSPRVCDDHNLCTADSCQTGLGCVNIPDPLACDDGNPCTNDTCDPVRGCAHEANTLACSDGNACTTADRCGAGVCVGTPISCDDGNPCTDDACSPTTGCAHVPNTGPCEDGDPRTVGDQCAAATCVPGPLGCAATPIEGCRVSLVPEKNQLMLKGGTQDSRSRFTWRWQEGQATRTTDFGNPDADGGTDFAFCVYDHDQGVPRLVMSSGLAAGGLCGGAPCWRAGATSFSYRDQDATHAPGIWSVTLRAGPDGAAAIAVLGRGAALDMVAPPLRQDPAVTVQLIGDGVCWQSDFRPPALVNRGGTFRDTGAP